MHPVYCSYDPRTGSCVSKTYADGSTVRYTCTPDNLPLRTTYASGRWTENVSDPRLVTKNYGALFRKSIPVSVHTVSERTDLLARVGDFMALYAEEK